MSTIVTVAMINDEIILGGGGMGKKLYYSKDKGASWEEIEKDTPFWDIVVTE